MSNFTFLETRWGDLARLGDLSEKYVYSDPNTSYTFRPYLFVEEE